ncbi:MAG: CBS domain-containing protein [Alphaproteobacteria bacterium]|nr:CBS domain-containing protein [Alphaproteobacteria bacterium]
MSGTIEATGAGEAQVERHRPAAAATNAAIRAKDIMTTDLVTIGPDTAVRGIAKLLGERRISAVPVLDRGRLVGIVSDGDLVHRQELGTAIEPPPRGDPDAAVALAYARSHGMRAGDVMTHAVITVVEDAPLAEVARALEASGIRCVPVTRAGKLVGIVSRADIVRALAARPTGSWGPAGSDDDVIRYQVIEILVGMRGTSSWLTTVTVEHGVVRLAGSIEDEAAPAPSHAAIEGLPYVVAVEDCRAVMQPY